MGISTSRDFTVLTFYMRFQLLAFYPVVVESFGFFQGSTFLFSQKDKKFIILQGNSLETILRI
jgi:hypothetical protein